MIQPEGFIDKKLGELTKCSTTPCKSNKLSRLVNSGVLNFLVPCDVGDRAQSVPPGHSESLLERIRENRISEELFGNPEVFFA